MRTFVFVAAGHRYALDASSVQAVHQLVRARAVPGGPPWLAGVIDVHGEFVPLVDAVALLRGTGAVRPTLGARVMLLDTGIGAGPRARFALAVDRVLDMVRTAINVAGDCVGAVVVHRLSPELHGEPAPAAPEAPG